MHKLTQNRHHVIFERKKAEEVPEINRLRRFAGMIMLMNMQDHGKLHQSLWGSMPFPDRDVADGLRQALPHWELGQPRDLHLSFAIDYLFEHDQDFTAEHLAEQRLWIMKTPILVNGVEIE